MTFLSPVSYISTPSTGTWASQSGAPVWVDGYQTAIALAAVRGCEVEGGPTLLFPALQWLPF